MPIKMNKLIQNKTKKFKFIELIKRFDEIYEFHNLNIMHLKGAFFLS